MLAVSRCRATPLSRKGLTVNQNRDDQPAGEGPKALPDVFARPDVFAKPEPPTGGRMPALVEGQSFDPAGIMSSIGEVPYEWMIESDILAWGPNAANVLMVSSHAMISSGRNYAKLLAAD